MNKSDAITLALIGVIVICIGVIGYFLYVVSTDGGQCVLNTYQYWVDHGGSCGMGGPNFEVNWSQLNLTQ